MVSYALFVCMLIAVQDLHPYIPLILIQSIGIIGPTVGVEWLYSVYEDYEYITIRSIVVQIASMILMFCVLYTNSLIIYYIQEF